MNRLLIVGASGFMGQRLLKKAIDQFEITCLLRSEETYQRLREIIGVDFYYRIGTLEDIVLCNDITKNVDIIINLAAVISGDELAQMGSNVDGFHNLAYAASKNGVKKYYYASSSSLYGDGEDIQAETDKVKLTNFYSVTKRIDELIAEYYNRVSATQFVGLRIFNLYGSDNIHSWDVTSKFFCNAIKNLPLIVSNGEASRDFIYVEDVVEITLELLNKTIDKNINIINIGTGQKTRMSDLAEMIIEITDSSSEIVIQEEVIPILTSCADISILKQYSIPSFSNLYSTLREIYNRNQEAWRKDV